MSDANALSPSASPAERLDFYTPIHKALRLFMTRVLSHVGMLDVTDAEERDRVLDEVDALLRQMRAHLQHENDFVHTALEARRPGSSCEIAAEHDEHLEAIADLQDEARVLRQARPEQRSRLALGLYRHLSAFVAANLKHMLVEERQHNALLWTLYRDDELAELHDRLMASIPQDEMAETLRWLAPALTPQELASLFGELQRKAPPEAVRPMLELAHRLLDAPRWAKLSRALGSTPAAGLAAA